MVLRRDVDLTSIRPPGPHEAAAVERFTSAHHSARPPRSTTPTFKVHLEIPLVRIALFNINKKSQLPNMPLIQSQVDNLPYIDPAPSDEALAAANALIQQELPPDAATALHTSIPELRNPQFSSLVDTEHAFLAEGKPRQTGIDLSRYEALDAPPAGSDVAAWRETLQKAYASAEYLRGRETNLALLETYGKNAWLVGNSQLEGLLKGLEVEIEAARIELEGIERERRDKQASVQGEV